MYVYMSFLQLKETSLRQACITPRDMSQVFIADCSIADQIEKNETGGASNTYRGEERCVQGFDRAP
jgi:hypothetical protein